MTPHPRETCPKADAIFVAGWRAMAPAEKLGLLTAMTRIAEELSLAGIRARHLHATGEDLRLRLAALRVAAVFEALDVAYALGGSLASSLHGETRATMDVDDVLGVLRVQRGRLDRGYLESRARRAGLAALLEKALAEAAA